MSMTNAGTRVASRQALGERLRAARKARGLDQITLATVAGVARGSVQHAESADAPVTVDTLLRITDALGLDLHLVPRWHEPAPTAWPAR